MQLLLPFASFCFDIFLRECHAYHEHCTGCQVVNDSCPLGALYEIMNRTYRRQRLQSTDIQHVPVIELT